MPRFYFHIVTSSMTIPDLEGTEVASLEAALAEAIQDARSLMSAAILNGLDISSRRIEIHDGNGLVRVVPFSDAITPDP